MDKAMLISESMEPLVVRLSDSVTIINADCLDVLPVECDAVVTDPPYFLPATHYSTRSGSARSLTDLGILEHYFSAVFKLAAACKAKWCYAFCDGQSYPVFYATAYPHWKKLRPLIWDKQASINGYAWRHQHELILFCESESAPAVPTGDGDVLRCRSVPIDDREHMAQKPHELLAQLVRKGDPQTVCDPFMGSGSTGIACIRTGRKFIGVEKDARYFEIARQRLENELRQGLLPLAYDNKTTVET
jgi:site-specific DNA-methyltransferase (adenine-specific)